MSLSNSSSRDGFTSKLGIVAATAGSAIGLGNIWRFPYLLGENGGGAFLLIYLGIVILIGIPVMMSEFVVGRRAGLNAFGSFKKLAPGTWWPAVGIIGIVAAFMILAFYTTVAGWTLHYVYFSVANVFQGVSPEGVTSIFHNFTSSYFWPLIWQFVFLLLTAGIIFFGVKRGIEKSCLIMMPFLVVLIIILCIRSVTLPGAMEGLNFIFRPDFSKINYQVLLAAMGQAFFSLSIGMGTLITYASYFPKETNLPGTALKVSMADLSIAVLAAIAIFPALFAFGMEPGQGAGLTFIILPNLFIQMPGGYFLSIIFFVMLAVAALTSTISIMEVVVAYVVQELGLARRTAIIITILTAGFVGVFCTLSWSVMADVQILGLTVFKLLDFIASNILLPLGGLLIVIFVGWYMTRKEVMDELTNNNSLKFKLFKGYRFIVKFLAPVAIAGIFLHLIGYF